MDAGERYPSLISEKETEALIIGSCNGQCKPITTGVANYLQSEGATNVKAKCASASSKFTDSDLDVDGCFFLFLHPSHSDKDSIEELNISVVKSAKYWLYANPMKSNKTIFVFEGNSDRISDLFTQMDTPDVVSDASEIYVSQGDIRSMQNQILSHYSNMGDL